MSNKHFFALNDSANILKDIHFHHNKRTTCYIHGYYENQTAESLQIIVDSYLERNDHNLIVLDWAELAAGRYMTDAVKNALLLSDVVAEAFIKLFKNGLQINTFHLIGHSLGGQLAGIIGRTIKKNTSEKLQLPRISALDPAFPGFYILPLRQPVNANDAEFVDIIHTDGCTSGNYFLQTNKKPPFAKGISGVKFRHGF